MLANHVYWNLGAFTDEASVYILNDTLYMPYADRWIETDGILIPNGDIGITNGTALDFTKPGKTIGEGVDATAGKDYCGTGCVGIDNAFILDRPRYATEDPGLEVLQMYSHSTGIQMSLETNMQGTQIYTCNGQNGTIPVKKDQEHLSKPTFVEKYGCVVVEAQDVSLSPMAVVHLRY
jgi:aldose 1-epimerase